MCFLHYSPKYTKNKETRQAKNWITSYTNNPVLRCVAQLIVWNQGADTFILTKEGVIDCNEQPYEIKEEVEIGVAHPIEMEKAQIEAWQKYFTSHNLKQPFAQIWEPAVEATSFQMLFALLRVEFCSAAFSARCVPTPPHVPRRASVTICGVMPFAA